MLVDMIQLKDIAGIEYGDVVEDVLITDINQMRIFLKDDSFVDVWYSLKIKGRYSYHWERKHIDGLIYRHDNAPHKKWQYTTTFPKHFHEGGEDKVIESDIHETPHEGLREFLHFIREALRKMKDLL